MRLRSDTAGIGKQSPQIRDLVAGEGFPVGGDKRHRVANGPTDGFRIEPLARLLRDAVRLLGILGRGVLHPAQGSDGQAMKDFMTMSAMLMPIFQRSATSMSMRPPNP